MTTCVIIEVSEANFTVDHGLFDNLDSHAKIEWCCPTNGVSVLSVTRTHKNNNSNPIWNFRCRPYPYRYNLEKVIITIENKSVLPTFHSFASVCVTVEELLSKPQEANQDGFHKLSLKSGTKGQLKGYVYARAKSFEMKEKIGIDFSDITQCKLANSALFEMPVKRLEVSGGTAPFFVLNLKNFSNDQTRNEYIGKDMAHAMDEFAFYEKMRYLKENGGIVDGLNDVLKFAFNYGGVLKAVDNEGQDRNLLVLKNLYTGRKKLRLLDIKIGFVTADAGWQGKSWLAAVRQYIVVDKITNSHHEGFRLEGFEGQPESLESRDPFMDAEYLRKERIEKKTRRRGLQMMRGIEIMPHYINLSELRLGPQSKQEDYYFPGEISELVMLETVIRLINLAISCRKVAIPQKWIGSSVALGFDCGTLPPRSEKYNTLREKVIVDIFDWGRSTLDVAQDRTNLSIADQKDYVKFWNSYTNGITHLSWSAAHYYIHRFTNSSKWEKVNIFVKDFDLTGSDDIVGSVELPLQNTEEKSYPIIKIPSKYSMNSLTRKKSIERGTLTCKIQWFSYPEASKIRGVWRVHILRANHLPNLDTNTLTDPYCIITAESNEGHKFEQCTKVIGNNLNPVWNETVEIPVMKSNCIFRTALAEAGLGSISDEAQLELFKEKSFRKNTNRLVDGITQLAYYEDLLRKVAA